MIGRGQARSACAQAELNSCDAQAADSVTSAAKAHAVKKGLEAWRSVWVQQKALGSEVVRRAAAQPQAQGHLDRLGEGRRNVS